jgi:cobalamin biosynthesis Mg chelatase CobN
MANGTTDERLARADRIAEQSNKAQRAAEQSRKATQNAIRNLRETQQLVTQPGSEPYREEMDSISEVTVNREGVKIKARSPWVTVVLAAFALVAFLGWLWLRRG